jgi:hypothetical protein
MFDDALRAGGPHPDHADELMLFGQFVGSWSFDAVKLQRDGTRQDLRGEWHFAWVLEGRAIQDVLISPPRSEAGTRFDYGTTLRFYDPLQQRWWITYVTPVGREVHQLFARPSGDQIQLEGIAPDGTHELWSFTDIGPDSFVWRGQTSSDGGRTWFTDELMRVRRTG